MVRYMRKDDSILKDKFFRVPHDIHDVAVDYALKNNIELKKAVSRMIRFAYAEWIKEITLANRQNRPPRSMPPIIK